MLFFFSPSFLFFFVSFSAAAVVLVVLVVVITAQIKQKPLFLKMRIAEYIPQLFFSFFCSLRSFFVVVIALIAFFFVFYFFCFVESLLLLFLLIEIKITINNDQWCKRERKNCYKSLLPLTRLMRPTFNKKKNV